MEDAIVHRLATLGHPQRLAILRLLVRRYPDHVPAGEIAQALDLRPSTLSAYLAALMRAGLAEQERRGTSLRYAAAMPALSETFGWLFSDCCRGRPAAHLPPALFPNPADTPMTRRKYKVLFICTGNSARSIFGEAILRKTGGKRFEAHSAGTRPNSEPNPFALEVLAQNGHDLAPLRSKHVSEYSGPDAPRLDFVFTVCNRAANEQCPAWVGQPVTSHWGMPDPVKVEGTAAEKALAFRQAYGALRNRIRAFAALPFDALDRIALQQAVDDIGRTTAGEPA